MIEFWENKIRKQYLFSEIYDIDSTILRFSNWFVIEHGVNLIRSYGFITPTGDGNYEHEAISEEDYINNQEDSNYLCYINYQDLSNRTDYNNICKEFETIINDTFIHEEQNFFLVFAQESIYEAQTDGQAKSLLKSILQTLSACTQKQKILLTKRNLNRLQEIIVEAYSSSYRDTIKALVKRYDDVYDQINKPFKESQPEKQQPETRKPNKHSHIFIGNAFDVWQYMFDFFGVKSSSRRDFKFMFDIMKYDKLIQDTVNQTAMFKWVDTTYGIIIEKINPNDFKKDTKRMRVYKHARTLFPDMDI